MTRLTNILRESIAKAVLTHRFQEDIANLTSDRAALADDVYCDIYSKTTREKMGALPKGWLTESNSIGVQFGENSRSYENLTFNGEFWGRIGKYCPVPSREDRRRVFATHGHGCVKVYTEDHELSRQHAELMARHDDLKTTVELAERQVSAALASASSISRLISLWPEVEPFAGPFDVKPEKLPAVPTDVLNKLLELPVSESR